MKKVARIALPFALLCAAPAFAGPPYDTDDPEPTDNGHWEIYSFLAAQGFRGTTEGAAGLDLNFGAAPGIQLTATLPIEFARDHGFAAGAGAAVLGVKYRFLHNEATGWSVAAFPRVILPTGSNGFGARRAAYQLPVWGQKDFGHGWSLFGGGGYTINRGAGNRSYWKEGVALTRDVTRRLTLGGEVTHQGRDAVGSAPTTSLGFGGTYRLKAPFALLFAAGPTLVHGGERARFHAYAALSLNY